MKRFNYSLIAGALALTSVGSIAETYKVVELGGVENTRHSFGIGLNNTDGVVGISTDHFNFPVDLQNLDIDSVTIGSLTSQLIEVRAKAPSAFPDVNLDEISNGIITAANLEFIKFYFAEEVIRESSRYQKIGNQSAFITQGTVTQDLVFFDASDDDHNGFTRNTIDLPNAINDNGVAVSAATARFSKQEYTPPVTDTNGSSETRTIWVKEYLDRIGVVSKGDQRVVIPSPETLYGGSTVLTDISDNNWVVGYAATSLSGGAQIGMEASCVGLTDPVALQDCAWGMKNTLNGQNPSETFYTIRAYRWKLDDALQVTESLDLGLSFPLDVDVHDGEYVSSATGVNELGHVVGFSDGFKTTSDQENDTNVRTVATYHDGTAVRSIIDQNDYRQSKAFDINDSDIVVGYAAKFFSTTLTKQFFYYDATTGTATHPNGFFSSSASVAHAINNHGVIVGMAEVESSITQYRREHGFIYDINVGVMTDLNDLTSCNNPYRIVEARDINDNGEIVGTAGFNVNKLDSLGNPVLDANGNPEQEQVTRAVKLVPVANATVDDCAVAEEQTYERKGAGFGAVPLVLLGALFGLRRRTKSKRR